MGVVMYTGTLAGLSDEPIVSATLSSGAADVAPGGTSNVNEPIESVLRTLLTGTSWNETRAG